MIKREDDIINIKTNVWSFDELINMYEEVLDEAQSLWLSDYCCSRSEAEARRAEDELKRRKFISICNRLKGEC